MRWSSLIPTGFLVPRSTWVYTPESSIYFDYRPFTFFGTPFQTLRLYIEFVTLRHGCNHIRIYPATPTIQRLQAWHMAGLGSFHFARRYSENHYCFLFLRLLRCFSSSRSPPWPMYSVMDDRVLSLPGSPIQIPSDQCLFSNSPMLFAAFHVFLRLLTPRHPPLALHSLATNHLLQSCWCIFSLHLFLLVSI